MAELTDRVVEFLSAGTRTGMLGFVASDGRPLVTPVWFVVDDGQLAFTTARNTPKGLALQRDPRVAICVDDPHPPYSFVQVQGTATLSDDPQDVLNVATRTGARYMGADRAEEFGRRNAVPGEVAVRIRPVKVIAGFDISD
ncbi:F420-dependent protein [Mycobacterium sp. 852002-51163_SCH5372311]|uniref:PPOX class F420-dependent oxidoreductase n=1 Tax=Mycobacterium sp. 852002-51163_SCH5372311 TaxID=1834097 RepID=UPI000802310F|nr:PPOX class F420-dependent oxidoreductase [Mycobacterium sp. 852002-51163_SCH5372311]OBF82824.1 F420-dependent protein [Mycobacterium sp. 852002-51163_SCH5372311]